ncbi:MAG: PEP-utilizing enzyme [Candidatus Woesearchaeota archaeon]
MTKNKKDNNWFLLEEIPNSFIFLLSGTFRRMTKEFYQNLNLPIHMNLLYKNKTLFLHFKRNELLKTAKSLFNKAIKEKNFLEKINLDNKKAQKNMFAFNSKIQNIKLDNIDNKEILEIYNTFALLFEKSIVAGWIDNIIEFENELFTKYLMKYIEKKTKKTKYNASEIFSLLTTPSKATYGLKQEKDLHKLIKFAKKDKNTIKLFKRSINHIKKEIKKINPNLYQKLELHTNKYKWYFYMYSGPEWKITNFISEIKNALNKNQEISNLKKYNITQKKKEIIKTLNINKKHQELFRSAEEIIYNKDLRKHAIYNSCYTSQKLFQNIGKRLKITANQAKNIMPWEMEFFFKEKNNKENNKQITNKNIKNILISREKGILMQFFKGKTEIANEQYTSDFFNTITKSNNKIINNNVIKGSCAFHGKVKGIVKVINVPSDMRKMKNNDIIVSHQTNPDLLPAMKKAAAFITDIGGITCHAAIVSRELKKPCIVGTKIATKVFKDDDIVEVDANKGIVKKIK